MSNTDLLNKVIYCDSNDDPDLNIENSRMYKLQNVLLCRNCGSTISMVLPKGLNIASVALDEKCCPACGCQRLGLSPSYVDQISVAVDNDRYLRVSKDVEELSMSVKEAVDSVYSSFRKLSRKVDAMESALERKHADYDQLRDDLRTLQNRYTDAGKWLYDLSKKAGKARKTTR